MPRQLRMMKDDRGASLTELCAVVTILSGVSAAALLTLTSLTANATAVACRANQETVRLAGVAYLTQSPLGASAPSTAALVAAGFLQSVPPDVSYTITGTSFEVSGIGPCAP